MSRASTGLVGQKTSCKAHITDSEEELFLTQNSFSQDILQPNFSLDSIFDPVVGSDEPAPRNSCAEELSKIVSEGSFKDKTESDTTKKVHVLVLLFFSILFCNEKHLQMTLLLE